MVSEIAKGLKVVGLVTEQYSEIITPEALDFVEKLIANFSEARDRLLKNREQSQAKLNKGILPDFLPETEWIRKADWTIKQIPCDLRDRRVEITGPVDRKMIINALNSGANVFMADFEDANSPTWDNIMQGQINLRDAINRTISFENPNGEIYRLNAKIATLMVRPRGWHLEEKHVLDNGKPISASIFDFGLFFFHNAKNLIEAGAGPYFYLPKLENHLEARLWNDIFVFSQDMLGIPQGTIKATVLIETIFAAFEMDEILYELREHSAGLNCGRWDYIFSFIKKFRNNPEFILPDRSQITMATPFMHAYSLLAIKTCHNRGTHAIGGMAAYIPVKNDKQANLSALEQVMLDKAREAMDGHDGTWVAHPDLVSVALDAFNRYMPKENQIDKRLDDVNITAQDLLLVPNGSITEHGLRTNISVGIQYIEAWLGGKGAVPINNLMEDAATAEISRAQVWQWIHNPKGFLADGRRVTEAMFNEIVTEELDRIKGKVGESEWSQHKYTEAINLFSMLTLNKDFIEFLTIPGYELLVNISDNGEEKA